MKTLSFDEMKRVSGAGHFGDVRDANMGKSNKNTGSNNKGNTGYYNNLGQDWICPYISRHLLSLNPLLARCRRYSRGER